VPRDRERPVKDEKKRAIASAHLDLVPAGTPDTPQGRDFAECPCPKRCAIHGECHLCVAYHARKGKPPRCQR
jgi:hypothetical protein